VPNPYETTRYLDEYLFFHYGRPRDFCPFLIFPNNLLRFHERIRRECLLPIERPAHRQTRALDIGCAVGRFSFELGRVADHVIGIDNSAPFIAAARQLARRRALTIRVQESGKLFSSRKLVLPKALASGSVEFHVRDAMDLSAFSASSFQIVAAINLLCRLPHPRRFLGQVRRLVAPGGQLIIASPFSWLQQYTPRREWLDDAEVQRALDPHFRLVRRRDLPFLIREHRRKYQLVVSDVMVFIRRN
jgi:putative 4-mercaptohistidine N1-methyltranferase